MFSTAHASASPPVAVASFHLSAQAEAELIAIYDYSEASFGRYQAEAYFSGLERTFGLLADFPGIGQSADHIAPGYRRFRFQSHYIFYSEKDGSIVIHALPHSAQDIRPELFK
jgi:toxin ParE1/3/4